MDKNVKRVKYACYTANISMSVVSALSPVLFLTFHFLYNISYSLLGFLILINFATQLLIDIIFSFYSHKFNIEKSVKITPLLTAVGLIIYGILPLIFPKFAYVGIIIGTIIFAISSGFAEVLISPVIASLPFKNPDKEMSKLHSAFAWGVVFVIISSTLMLHFLGRENWFIIPFFMAIIPLVSTVLFFNAKLPYMETSKKSKDVISKLKNKFLWLSVISIFLGGASECAMSQWCSSYLEKSFAIKKIYGDIFGVALFSLMLGLGRSLYARIGKNIERVILMGSFFAFICYIISVFTNNALVGLLACGITGFTVSMLWPGNLIIVAKRFKGAEVFIYALMAAGGDLGASLVPQLVGLVTDFIIKNNNIVMNEQMGLKGGILVASIFPLMGVIVNFIIYKTRKREEF